MKVKQEATAGIIVNAQAAESHQTVATAPADDSSAKTIEFLRARLLAERSTSKSARQQAHEMSEKVKNLHIRLETEVEHRKEAEAAMGKVLLVLKAKGTVTDPAYLNGKSVGDPPSSHYVEEAKGISGEAPRHTADYCCSKGVQHPRRKRDENSTTTELHGNSSVVEGTEDTSSTIDACGTESEICISLIDSAEQHSCLMNQVQGVDHKTTEVCPDTHTNDGTPISKVDMRRGQSIQQGLCIATKLKTMLQQIEEEVGALPEEQPLRTKLQGLAGHLANMLERGQEADSENKQSEMINCSLEGPTALETRIGTDTHLKLPVQSKYAYEMNVNEPRRQPGSEMLEMDEGKGRGGRLVRLFSSPKAPLQQRHLVSSTGTLSTPAMEDTLLQKSNGEPSCDFVNGGNRDAYAGHCLIDRGLLTPHAFQYDNPHLQRCPPKIHWGQISKSNNLMGLETPYLVEVPSPGRSDALSVGDNVGYTHGQHNEGWSPTRASSGQNAWSTPARAMLPNGYFINDISNDLLMKLDSGYYNHQNMYFQAGFPPHSILHSHQERDLRNSALRATARQQVKDCLPFNDAALSVMDDRNGRLGSILMSLDAARQHMIQGEELMRPPTPTAVDARGYPYGDCVQQLPPDYQHDNRRSHSRAPIVQFPLSPTSEQGYPPSFERPLGVHHRSSSVSTNFMLSEWGNSLQPSEEIHLGNGITLYTD